MTTTNGTNDEVTEATLAGQTAANDDAVAMDGENGNGDGPPNGVVSNPMPGNVRAADIVGEMQNAYLDYAMSVIVARALPDVRDGLKPVHRRILYAMSHDLYLHHTKPHRKSARIVGEVLGKYHPHGDVAVYDAMVRMAQDFSLRYPLVDGQGNFGSIDGDGAAAMRYTEARLAEIAELMLTDLDKDTVGWHDNFDNSLEEPDVLPAALPNLLINGSSGIAVGMATNIPPHNLNEIVDALVYLIDHYSGVEEITVDELLQFVKGPDFPTGGILYRFREDKVDENTDVIAQGYSMGKARLVMQAKAHFEEMSRGRSRIVVTELPYQTNKTALIERIASLARDAKIEGITDLRDESDRTGMRIVIELTRNADPKDILKDLFKYTPLQQTFGMQMLALVDGQPRLLSLKRALHLFVQHREEIIRRRSEYDLAKARDRAHIVEGLLKALDILDEVIDTIRRSQTVETARNNLVKNFKFTEIQAQAILDMQLRRLAALERKKLKDEHDELLARIAYLEDLLAHPEKILAVIREELLAQKEKYGDARRTQIVDRTKGTLTTTDLLPQQEVWVTVSADGELRRQDVSKPSVAIMRQLAKHGQVAMLTANTRDWLYVFCRDGRCTRIAIHEIPQNGSPKHVAELSDLTRRDMITAAISLPRIGADQAKGYLFLATALGMVKRVTVADFVGTVANEFSAINVDDKDRLGWVVPTIGGQDIMLVTAAGQSIRFSEEDVRSMGLAAGGVGGIKLKKKDVVIFADAVESDGAGTLMTMTAQGYAKRSDLSEYSRQGRHGGGIVTHKPTGRTGDVVTAIFLDQTMGEEELLAAVTAKQQVKPLTVAEIPIMGRGVQGKQVVELGKSDQMSVLKCLRASTTPGTPDPFNGGHGDGNGNGAVDVASNGSGSTQPSATPTAAGTTARVRSTKSAQRTERSRSVAATSSRAPAAQSRRTATKPTGRSPAAPAENAGIAKATARAQSTSKRKSSPAQSVLIDAKPTSPQKSRPQTTSSSRAQTKPSTAVRSGNVAAKASEKNSTTPKRRSTAPAKGKQIKPDATAETSQSKRTSTKPSAGRIQSNGTQASSARSGTARANATEATKSKGSASGKSTKRYASTTAGISDRTVTKGSQGKANAQPVVKQSARKDARPVGAAPQESTATPTKSVGNGTASRKRKQDMSSATVPATDATVPRSTESRAPKRDTKGTDKVARARSAVSKATRSTKQQSTAQEKPQTLTLFPMEELPSKPAKAATKKKPAAPTATKRANKKLAVATTVRKSTKRT